MAGVYGAIVKVIVLSSVTIVKYSFGNIACIFYNIFVLKCALYLEKKIK